MTTNGFLNSIAAGTSFKIIDNDGTTDTVQGMFGNANASGDVLLMPASPFYSYTQAYHVDTHGGDGNDVVVTMINTQPNLYTVPGAQNVMAGSSLAFSGSKKIDVADADENSPQSLTATLSVAHGTLSTSGTATVHSGDGTSTVTITGTASHVDTTLHTLVYTANSGFGGADSLAITVQDDSGASNSTASASVTISVAQKDFSAATENLTVDLAAGTADGPSGGSFGHRDVTGVNAILTGSGQDSVSGNANPNFISTNEGNDTVFAGAGNDTVLGGNGNDTLVGAADIFAVEHNSLDGGAGDDTLYAGAGDTVQGGSGFDVLHVVNSYAFSLDLGATSIEYVLSDFGNDTFNATTQTVGVQIYSSGGNDLITGSGLADVVFAGPGNDTAFGGDGNDVIIGDVGADSLSGGSGDDLMYVDSSDIFIDGEAGRDAVFITGVSGDPGIILDMGASHLEYAADFAGNSDSISAATSAVAVEVYANAGNDTIVGGTGPDFLWGEAGNDTISGGGGNDVLVGGQGADRLIGGPGIDALYGNSGGGNDGAVDTFVFTPGSGTDVVFDFVHGQDKLDMKAYGTDFSHLTIAADSGNAAIYFDGTTFVASVAGNAGQITAGDFLFV